MWLPTDMYLRQAADDLCLQLSLLGLSESICLFHPLWPLAHPSVTSLTLWIFKVLSVAVQVSRSHYLGGLVL
jgi:hypothetical protein